MAIACPINLDTGKLRSEIRAVYAQVAADPSGDFHFHRGPAYAEEFLYYDGRKLAEFPPECSASFAGIANPHRMGPIGEGKTVVDIGCGAGMDLLLAARDVGPAGRAIGIDMTEAMLEKAMRSARAASLNNVEVRLGDATSLPLEDESVDVVISNGVMNLVPDKAIAYNEVFRILKSGGRFLYGDIVIGNELSESARSNIDLWTG